MSMLRPGRLCFAFLLLSAAACKDDNKGPGGDPPPPPPPPASSASSGRPGACASGGGELTDAVSAAYLPKKVSSYCVDPQGEIKTYGEKGKSSMDEVCTTAFDGECEVYKKFGLKRVVSLHYVDGAGGSGTVEVNVSSFADAAGAYGMFTLRVVAGDPADPSTPKPFAAGAAGAIGTGRAYVWRGVHLVELQYNNEQEAPDALAKSSDVILRAVGIDIGSKLPGPTTLPPAAAALPDANRVANGIVFQPKDVMGFTGVGPGAIGFYKDGDRRWRTLAVFKDDADQAKDAFKSMKSKPGSLPITGIGDEAVHVVVAPPAANAANATKTEFLIARKGSQIWGVGDEEYALRGKGADDKARLTKDEATAKMKTLLAAPGVPAASGSSASPPSPPPPPPSSSSAAPKK